MEQFCNGLISYLWRLKNGKYDLILLGYGEE